MKIRNGFVSNSSTSSFILFGWNINGMETLIDIVNKYFIKKEKPIEYNSGVIVNIEDYNHLGISKNYNDLEIITTIIQKEIGLDAYQIDEYYDEYIIGESLDIYNMTIDIDEFITKLNKTKNILKDIDPERKVVVINKVDEDR